MHTAHTDPTHDDGEPRTAPAAAAGHETVFKFVFSGPILADGSAAHVTQMPPADDALRERVAALERALADTQAQLHSLATAIRTDDRVATTAGRFSVRAPSVAVVGGSVGPPSVAGGAAATAAAPGRPSSDRIPLAAVPSREREHAPAAAEPKARGLRRMIFVLKHDH